MSDRPTRAQLWLGRVRVRVTLAAVGVSLIGATVGSTLFVAALHENLEQALLSSARQQADTIAAQLDSGDSAAQSTVTGRRDMIVQVVGPAGELLASDHPRVTEPIRTSPGTTQTAHIRTLDDTFAVYARRARSGNVVVVGLSEEQLTRATDVAILMLGIAVPVGVLLLGTVVWLSTGRALRPVEVMRREAAAITSERLHERLAVPVGEDEIRHLATTLNEMLDRIDLTQKQQRQFVSDASHELRSPLAIVRQMLEVARRHPGGTTVTELADEIWEEQLRMEKLVRALLTLARLDDQELARPQVVDLDDAVLQEVDRIRPKETAIVFDRARVSAGQVYGDPVLFSQVVTNLITNAARHAESTVRVSLDEVDESVVLVVEDDGNGIAPEDRERVFERFARLDEARARQTGGIGLGLAIVQKVVEAARGTVSVAESELGGARFAVTLPTAASRGQK